VREGEDNEKGWWRRVIETFSREYFFARDYKLRSLDELL
jgi:hypothetical protein